MDERDLMPDGETVALPLSDPEDSPASPQENRRQGRLGSRKTPLVFATLAILAVTILSAAVLVVTLSDEAAALHNEGVDMLDAGDWEGAVVVFTQVIELEPGG